MMAVSRILLSKALYGFSGFAKEVTSRTRAKTVVPGDHLHQLDECMTNLLLTEREGRTTEYWSKVVAVRTERSEVRTKRPRANIPRYGSS